MDRVFRKTLQITYRVVFLPGLFRRSGTDCADRARATLLDHVRQLMGNQFLTAAGAGIIFSLFEENILSGGKGFGIEIAVQVVCLRGSVDPDPAEVIAHTLPHLPLQAAVQSSSAPPGLVDPAGGLFIQAEGPIATALG